MFDPIVAYLFESSNLLSQEVNYIRAEMHEHEQFLDRQQIEEEEFREKSRSRQQQEQDEAEENERQWREWQHTHQQAQTGGVQ